MTLGNRKTKTSAWDILVDLDEALEDALLIGLGNTLTGIENPHHYLIAMRQIETNGDRTLGGKLNGILNKICDNFLYLVNIGSNHKLGDRELGSKDNRLRIDHSREGIDNLLEYRHKIDLLFDKTLSLGLNLRHANQTIDNAEQFVVVFLNLRNELITILLALDNRQQIGKSYDGVERGSDLMTHVGKEGCLKAVALLSLVTCSDKRSLHLLLGIDTERGTHHSGRITILIAG